MLLLLLLMMMMMMGLLSNIFGSSTSKLPRLQRLCEHVCIRDVKPRIASFSQHQHHQQHHHLISHNAPKLHHECLCPAAASALSLYLF
jgi:hypothetical protein